MAKCDSDGNISRADARFGTDARSGYDTSQKSFVSGLPVTLHSQRKLVAMGLLVAARNSVDKNSGKLHLCGLPPQVKKTFDQTNLTNYFSIFTTEQDALRGA